VNELNVAGASRQRFPSLLFEEEPRAWTPTVAEADPSFARDLNLDQIVQAIAADREQRALITSVLYSPLRDAAAVEYRQEVFRDLEDAVQLAAARDFADGMSEVAGQVRQLAHMEYRYQREGWLLDAAFRYCETVRSYAGQLTAARVSSRALAAFRDYLAGYVSSPAFTALADDTRERKAALSRIRYNTRIHGGRVDVSRYEGEADYSSVVLKTFERFAQDAPKDYRIQYRGWPGMNHIAAEIAAIVARLFPEEFADLAEYCRRHAAFLDDGVRRAAAELQFYLAYVEYTGPLRQAGLSFCQPRVSASTKEVSAVDTFDLALAHKLVAKHKPVITNDFRLADGERALVVTGPNQGGKTTFARTFGQLHHLAGTGCPVPGSAACLFLPDRVFTHFERVEDLARMSGKLEDDLVRVGEILQQATPASVIVLNETFASTTLHDARFLGTKLLTKVLRLDALCVYVTFVDELAALGGQVVSMMSTVVAENPAERTFKVIRKPADGLAYALAIAEKYDLSYERLRERLTQ